MDHEIEKNFQHLTDFILPHTDTGNITHKPIEAIQWGDYQLITWGRY